MIQVETGDKSNPLGHMPMVWFCRAPFLLTIRSDMDPIPVPAGTMLGLNEDAFDESPELCGAMTALISIGAVTLVRAIGQVH